MKKNAINSNHGPGPSERSSYHRPPPSSSDRKCDDCNYKVPINECSTFKCKDCGTYIVNLLIEPT